MENDTVEPAAPDNSSPRLADQGLQLITESSAMCEYALTNGLEVPSQLVQRLCVLTAAPDAEMEEQELGELAAIHQQLNRIISPATPQAVVLIGNKSRQNLLSFLGAVPIVRHIMLISLFFLVAFMVIGQMEIINEDNLTSGILGSHGAVAVAVLSYLICCAGLGACFTCLYRLNDYVSKAVYDPRYDSTYWTSILLGVIAGVFISELLFSVLFSHAALPGGDSALIENHADNLGKPALALFGGFSANMVYKILQRLVDSVESLVRGDQNAINQARRAVEVSQLKSQKKELHMEVANQLVALEQDLKNDPEQAQTKVKQAIDQLLGGRDRNT
ncbi:MAG: hypothetical protein V3T17_06600 [Pseudomonadales bacterium]